MSQEKPFSPLLVEVHKDSDILEGTSVLSYKISVHLNTSFICYLLFVSFHSKYVHYSITYNCKAMKINVHKLYFRILQRILKYDEN